MIWGHAVRLNFEQHGALKKRDGNDQRRIWLHAHDDALNPAESASLDAYLLASRQKCKGLQLSVSPDRASQRSKFSLIKGDGVRPRADDTNNARGRQNR